MNFIDRLKVKVWANKPYPLETKLKRGCPLCRSPLVLAEGEKERSDEENAKQAGIVGTIMDTDTGKLTKLRQLARIKTRMGVAFTCTKDDCPFNEEIPDGKTDAKPGMG
jgi:hypothetical protein